MRFWKHVAAAAAGVVVYRLVDRGLRRFERRAMDRDVPKEPPISSIKKHAIVHVGSSIDRIPDAEQRDRIARLLNLTLSVGSTATYLAARERLLQGVMDDEEVPEHPYLSSLVMATGVFVVKDLLMKPAMGLGSPSSTARGYVCHLASKAAQTSTLRLLDEV